MPTLTKIDIPASDSESRLVAGEHLSVIKFEAYVQDILDTSRSKRKDYSPGDDPFANIKTSAQEIGLPEIVGCWLRMRDKVTRIITAMHQLVTTGSYTMANESLDDSFKDLAVYSTIARVLLAEMEERKAA